VQDDLIFCKLVEQFVFKKFEERFETWSEECTEGEQQIDESSRGWHRQFVLLGEHSRDLASECEPTNIKVNDNSLTKNFIL